MGIAFDSMAVVQIYSAEMAKKPAKKKAQKLPYYLPKPDNKLLKWIGDYLQKLRTTKTPEEVANDAGTTPEDIKKIESGKIHHNLGSFRRILRTGYGCTLEKVLADCFEAHKDQFDSGRKFERDTHYSFRNRTKGGNLPTPILIGGDPKKFLWVAPLRHLQNQPVAVDWLELAPNKKREEIGTPEDTHDGVEAVCVIHGAIRVQIKNTEAGSRPLYPRDGIHYCSRFPHQIVNDNDSQCAFMVIVRLPEFSLNK
jgi:hypothetical protein